MPAWIFIAKQRPEAGARVPVWMHSASLGVLAGFYDAPPNDPDAAHWKNLECTAEFEDVEYWMPRTAGQETPEPPSV